MFHSYANFPYPLRVCSLGKYLFDSFMPFWNQVEDVKSKSAGGIFLWYKNTQYTVTKILF